MPWAGLQDSLRRVAAPLRKLTSLYALLLGFFTLLRFLRVGGHPALDLAHTFAPYWYLPLMVAFPLSVVATRGGPMSMQRARKRLALPGGDDEARRVQPPRWSVFLQIALIVIGLYNFALPAMYKPALPPTGDAISLATLNVRGSNLELERATQWLLDAAPDLIVLQETAGERDPRLDPLYRVYAHEDHLEAGVRVFSNCPVLAREVVVIEDAPGREALRLLIDCAGRRFALYAAHMTLPLQPRPLPDPDADIGLEALLRYDESRRNRQIRRLIDALNSETAPTVVAGDFNMSDASLIYDELAAVLDDAWRAAGNGAGRTWPVADAIGLPRLIHPLLRIDYVWHSEHFRAAAAQVGEPVGSDHLPVAVVLEWRSA